jgi:hypothetical protein
MGMACLMAPPESWPTCPPDLGYYEAVPYLLVVESVKRGGEWLRRAAYPELPDCAVEAPSAIEAVERLEDERRRVLRQLWERGAEIPLPRPALRASLAGANPDGSPAET